MRESLCTRNHRFQILAERLHGRSGVVEEFHDLLGEAILGGGFGEETARRLPGHCVVLHAVAVNTERQQRAESRGSGGVLRQGIGESLRGERMVLAAPTDVVAGDVADARIVRHHIPGDRQRAGRVTGLGGGLRGAGEGIVPVILARIGGEVTACLRLDLGWIRFRGDHRIDEMAVGFGIACAEGFPERPDRVRMLPELAFEAALQESDPPRGTRVDLPATAGDRLRDLQALRPFLTTHRGLHALDGDTC